MSFSRIARAGLFAACALLCLSEAAHAQASGAQSAAGAASAGLVVTPGFQGDDPAAVRNALAGTTADHSRRSIIKRIRDLVGAEFPTTLRDPVVVDAGLNRELAFVVLAPGGIHYRASSQVMAVDVGVSDGDHPDSVILRKNVTGRSGRDLVVAAEAKSKGFIQKIDLIELDAVGKSTRATVSGRFTLAPDVFARSDGNFAIVFLCRVVPPYLTETLDHSDPTDDDPTDITTRASTLHAKLDDIWLIDEQKGIVLAKGLRLTK
jgi:hypothetical protein